MRVLGIIILGHMTLSMKHPYFANEVSYILLFRSLILPTPSPYSALTFWLFCAFSLAGVQGLLL
jgi:hypothetical protein